MRCNAIAVLLAFAAGCHGDGSISPPRPVDAGESIDATPAIDAAEPVDAAESTVDASIVDAASAPDAAPALDAAIDAGPTCAVAQAAEWAGSARIYHGGAGGGESTEATVRWMLTSSTDCIDQFRPAGTAYYVVSSGQCGVVINPNSEPIVASDGYLTIDRRTSPAHYQLSGRNEWMATFECQGDPPSNPTLVGGFWANASGTFDGDLIAGGMDDGQTVVSWRFVPSGVSFPPPAPGTCAEPSSAHWQGSASASYGTIATITWTRIRTTGCYDVFQPSGTATAPTSNSSCTTVVTEPPSQPIAATEGELVIDRSTAPPTFAMHGTTEWQGTRTCTRPDGTVDTTTGFMGGPWAWYIEGSYDGDAWSGAMPFTSTSELTWSLRRAP